MSYATLSQSLDVSTPPEWISGPQELRGMSFTLRALRPEDAPLLLETLTFDELANVIQTTPALRCDPSIWANREPDTSSHVCFAVVPEGMDVAVGIFHLRSSHKPVVMH